MSGTYGTLTKQDQLECRVTKRSKGHEITGTKVFQEFQRLGVSPAIIESLRIAQECHAATLHAGEKTC